MSNATSSLALTGQYTADVGVLKATEQTDAQHVYDLVNTSGKTVEVGGIRGTCGCEHLALITGGGNEVQHATLQPGGHIQARVAVKLQGQPPGKISKMAYVYAPDNPFHTLAVLTITFEVKQPFSITPAQIDFGAVGAGSFGATRPTATLSLTVDKAALAGGKLPALTSDSDALTAVQVGGLKSGIDHGDAYAGADYQVTLNNPNLVGPFRSSLRFSVLEHGQTNWVSVPVRATVIGSVAVTPTAVFFGSVALGATPQRSVIVTAKSAAALAAIQAISASPWVRATLVPNPSQPASCLLRVTLAPDAPAGAIDTTINLATGPSQSPSEVIPVHAEIDSP